MSEERLQEIKDSISLQYKVQEANDLNNFNIFTDEEQELVDEIDRLNNMIERLNNQLQQKENIIKEVREYIEMHTPSDIGICGNKTKRYYTLGEDSVDHILEILDKVD